MEKRARELERLGNFKTAEKIYTNLRNNSETTDDKYYYSRKAESAKNLNLKTSKLEVGQSFFPVFVERINTGAIFTIYLKASKEVESSISFFSKVDDYVVTVGNLTKNWEYIKQLLVKFLNNYLEKNLKNYLVYDWNLDDLHPFIQKIPNQKNNEELYDLIEGNSVQLALIFAFLSKFFKTTISSYVFTGKLSESQNTIRIESVNEIQAKLEITKIERPMAKLVCNSDIIDDKLRSFDNLENLITKMFTSFNKILADSIENSNNEKFRYLYVKTLKNIQTVDGQKSTVLRFEHKNFNEACRLLNFFRQNLELFSPAAEGVIIDGLKPAFAIGLLAGMEEIKNTISGFIAVRNTQNDSQGETSAVVIKSGPNSKRKAGETFRYYNSK